MIGRLPGEQSWLSLVRAVLDRASRGWRGVEMTPAVVRRLQNLRKDLIEPPRERDDKEVADESVQLRFRTSQAGFPPQPVDQA
jgi:putative transposase